MSTQPSIIFMGTPDFSVPTLKALHASPFTVSLVVTQPDRPKGRGRKLAPSPVKIAAQDMDYEVFQPEKIRDDTVIDYLQLKKPDFFVVIAFGQILPKSVLAIPSCAPVNVHASLLPKYRGPAPIQWSIMRGEKKTGVTTMLMDHGVDTGDILLSAGTPIDEEDTAQSLHDRLAELGAGLLIETIHRLWKGTLFPHAQNNNLATYAPILKKADGRIDWRQPASTLNALVRAMTPWPGAFCYIGDSRLRIYKARAMQSALVFTPGTVTIGFPDELRIATGDGLLSIEEIQGDSGKRMLIKDYLHGNPISPGTILS